MMGSTFSRFWDQTYFIPKPTFTEKDLPDQTGKVHLITGGYAGLGADLARLLYSRNATIYIAGRNPSKAATAIDAIKAVYPDSKGRLEFLKLELDDFRTIAPAVAEFLAKEERLDVLVNNAGVMSSPKEARGKQGHNLQIATNVLGPFLLTSLLMPLLQKTAATSPTASVRVVWAASSALDLTAPNGGVPFDAAGAPLTDFRPETLYGLTKAADVILSKEVARKWGDSGVMSLAFHPGNLKTELGRHTHLFGKLLMTLISHPSILGAYTELFAGWSPTVTPDKNGAYIIPWGRFGDYNKALADAIENDAGGKLWTWCEAETKAYVGQAYVG
ncbi:short-chain dehydrogenase [Mytilinidion resinicola]|uniref:Short-chain dehydrogenase n=1 Tax=Mytilinidion resinicola TaxID=574789 RepID=A0A6A6Y8F8_9PEZI|nr:short-chain dehydrogenase [Mytilinidion resinicola]KAF2804980.1 short-chain dehydrogenase [Mytilinidion resinicola]